MDDSQGLRGPLRRVGVAPPGNGERFHLHRDNPRLSAAGLGGGGGWANSRELTMVRRAAAAPPSRP